MSSYLRIKGLINDITDLAELNRIVMYARTRMRQVQEEAQWTTDDAR